MRPGRGAKLVVPALVAVLLLALGVPLLVWYGSLHAGRRALAEGRALDAEDQFARAMALPFEPWLAPFNRGVARYEGGKWDDAAADFELAALRAPVDRDCMIRINWSAALERSADVLAGEDDLPGASARYQQALVVLATATCPADEQAPDGGSLAERQSGDRQRLAEKAGAAPSQEPQEPDEGSGDDRSRELERRAEQAQQERQRSEDRADPRTGGAGQRTW
ncbi:hypothetical protein [uncultured Tessaracoccus sp.]|uniref:hypothetical protein n=1 Tax=uncultured Tessaracoccus sp. TaxID=905023 RepID=UPI0025E002FB|nr:hypothetical protein [uncultured Tessaracoccus sp.]